MNDGMIFVKRLPKNEAGNSLKMNRHGIHIAKVCESFFPKPSGQRSPEAILLRIWIESKVVGTFHKSLVKVFNGRTKSKKPEIRLTQLPETLGENSSVGDWIILQKVRDRSFELWIAKADSPPANILRLTIKKSSGKIIPEHELRLFLPWNLGRQGEDGNPQVASEQIELDHPLAEGNPPSWACGWGEDDFGPWTQFRIGEARQRMRWILPGRFTMGSPDSEVGRYPNEGPCQEVQITQGFWMFDTPCTQRLWQAVMANNPSEFKSPDNPVERVSWEDCLEFIFRINEAIPSLMLTLPTEAQWEYACRAGTQTATYLGNLNIREKHSSPTLDTIAWYSGNRGNNISLKDDNTTHDYVQVKSTAGGTRSVRGKKPNAWGLFDVLGNVWEWCQDGLRQYESKLVIEPIGPMVESAGRVIRGGGWRNYPLLLRAARRIASPAASRVNDLGFRCISIPCTIQEDRSK